MTLFFNLTTLENETCNDPAYLVIALQKFYNGQKFPKNIKEQYKPIKALKAGTSFLLNPNSLFDDKSTDILFKAQYIRLAGRRDYQMYKQYKIASLDLSMYPDINSAAVRNNPLLKIANNQLYFIYEELKNGNQL